MPARRVFLSVLSSLVLAGPLSGCHQDGDPAAEPTEAAESAESTGTGVRAIVSERLSVHPVVAPRSAVSDEPEEEGNRILVAPLGEFLELGPKLLGGEEISHLEALDAEEAQGQPVVEVTFSESGADIWHAAVRQLCASEPDQQPRIAWVLDEEIVVAPALQCASIERTEAMWISGDFSRDEVEELVERASEESPSE